MVPPAVSLEKERIQYWISKGAQTSDTVHNILVDQGVIKSEKRAHSQIAKRRKEKMAKETKA